MIDPGMAEERTALAWNRTGLSCFAAAAIALEVFWDRSGPGMALAAVLVVMGVIAYGAGRRRDERSTPQRLRVLSLATSAVAVLAAIIG